MYRRVWKLGSINIRRIRYAEDIIDDERNGYRLGFTLNILPCLRVSNSYGYLSVTLAWMAWEILWFRYKDNRIEYDLQGNMVRHHGGIRHLLSMRWLWRRCKKR